MCDSATVKCDSEVRVGVGAVHESNSGKTDYNKPHHTTPNGTQKVQKASRPHDQYNRTETPEDEACAAANHCCSPRQCLLRTMIINYISVACQPAYRALSQHRGHPQAPCSMTGRPARARPNSMPLARRGETSHQGKRPMPAQRPGHRQSRRKTSRDHSEKAAHDETWRHSERRTIEGEVDSEADETRRDQIIKRGYCYVECFCVLRAVRQRKRSSCRRMVDPGDMGRPQKSRRGTYAAQWPLWPAAASAQRLTQPTKNPSQPATHSLTPRCHFSTTRATS